MRVCILAILSALILCGCKSTEFGPYTAPRVVGQVVDAETENPLAGVTVRRGVSRRDPANMKGAELMMEKVPARTDEAGRFEFPSQRALTIFRPGGWRTVRLTFERAGYERFSTNYTMGKPGTNAVPGEPIIETGKVLLKRTAL